MASPFVIDFYTMVSAWCLYQARWSIEQVPLVVKQTLEGIGDRPLAKGSLGTSLSETVKSGLKRAQNIIRWKV
jgi:hypothetical protein